MSLFIIAIMNGSFDLECQKERSYVMEFTKMHGLGNDFVVVYGEQELPLTRLSWR